MAHVSQSPLQASRCTCQFSFRIKAFSIKTEERLKETAEAVGRAA